MGILNWLLGKNNSSSTSKKFIKTEDKEVLKRKLDLTNKVENKIKTTYSSTRLLFKRDEIEPLDWDEKFRVYASNDQCTYEMTKREFYDVFSNVVKTKSYRDAGVYHYHKTPSKAVQFIV